MENLSETIIHRISRWLARPNREVGAQSTLFGAMATCTGNVRKENQDRAVIANYSGNGDRDSFTTWLLCDGIGGLREGDAAAEHTIAAVLTGLIARNAIEQSAIQTAVQNANRYVYNRFKEQGGSTLSLVVNSSDCSFAVNVGDSRIYRVDSQSVVQLSTDDTIGNQLRLLAGSGANVTGGLFAHHLSQYIGIGGDLLIKPLEQFHLEDKGEVLLTSDGVHSIESKVFDGIALSARSPIERAQRLVYLSKWCGGKDNASAICLPLRLPNRNQSPSGLLQLWDSFSKLEMFIDRSSVSQPIDTGRLSKPEAHQTPKPPVSFSQPVKVSNEPQIEQKKRRQRKGGAKQPKARPEAEITENIEESAS
jgi:PPM family protein phosphatase